MGLAVGAMAGAGGGEGTDHNSLLVSVVTSHVMQNTGVPHVVVMPGLTFDEPQTGQRRMVAVGVRCLIISSDLRVRVSMFAP
jgi:hypothetical protein